MVQTHEKQADGTKKSCGAHIIALEKVKKR
jgi:hypothetical protein